MSMFAIARADVAGIKKGTKYQITIKDANTYEVKLAHDLTWDYHKGNFYTPFEELDMDVPTLNKLLNGIDKAYEEEIHFFDTLESFVANRLTGLQNQYQFSVL